MLVALTVTGLLVALLLPFVTQIVGGWALRSRQGESDDQIMRAGLRLQAEVAALVPLPLPTAPGSQRKPLAFHGEPDSCRFVTPAPEDVGGGLQTVALSIDETGGRSVLTRRRARFDPARFDDDPRGLDAPVAVMDGRAILRFAYVAQDGTRSDQWPPAAELPARIELTVRSPDRRSRSVTIVLVPAAR